MRWPTTLGSVLGVLVVGACASTDEPPSAGTPFTIWVFEERLSADGVDRPIGGARVALDPANGRERLTKTTEADGHVTFDTDFSRGGASVTVLSADHVYLTMLEASPETARARPNASGKPPSDLVVFPPPLDRVTTSSTVELRGSLLGKQDRNDVVSLGVGSIRRLGATQALASTYMLRAPRDRPFFLLGHETKTLVDKEGVVVTSELVKSFRLDLTARADDELLDLDLSALPPLPAHRSRVHLEAPAGGPFGPGTRASASIESLDSGIAVGLFAASSSADGRAFDVDVTVVDTDVGAERIASHAVLTAADGSRSVRSEQGVTADGFSWKDFPLPPSIPDAATIRDPISLEGFPAGGDLVASVFAGGGLVWILRGPPGGPRGRTFTVPYRGEIGAVDVQVFAVSVAAQMDRVELPGGAELYRRGSVSRDVLLRK